MKRALIAWIAAVVLASPVVAEEPPASIEQAVKDFRAVLGELVAVDTTNPPGNEARAIDIVARKLDAAKIPYEVTEFAPGRKNLIARMKGDGSAKPLLLLAHVDVVGAEGQAWTSPPHEVTERDGYLVGRGVSDDLGMAVLNLDTLLWLTRSGTKLKRDVVVAFTGDEESGGGGIRWQIEHHPESLDAEIALNEGGGIRLDDHGTPIVVELQSAEKTYQDFELIAKGTTGHSSVPMPDNAIYRLAGALDRIGKVRRPARLLDVTRQNFRARAAVESGDLAAALATAAAAKGNIPPATLSKLEANPMLDARLRTTCVATLVSGGTRVNALPAEAKAQVNCRILPDESIESARQSLIKAIADPEVHVEPLNSFGSGPPSPLSGPVPAAITKLITARWPKVVVVPNMSLGATDSRFLRQKGVACYGFSPIAMSEADARRAHGIDERIPVASLAPAIEMQRELVRMLAAE